MVGYVVSASKTLNNCKLLKDGDNATFDILLVGY